VAILVANLQLVSQAPTISVAVLDDAAVPREWLQQAKNELDRIYREIDVDIVWWDLTPGGDHATRASTSADNRDQTERGFITEATFRGHDRDYIRHSR